MWEADKVTAGSTNPLWFNYVDVSMATQRRRQSAGEAHSAGNMIISKVKRKQQYKNIEKMAVGAFMCIYV